MTTPKPHLLYKLRDAADLLKLANAETPHSPTGLRNWADQGRIKHVRLSDGERVIRGSELIRLAKPRGDDLGAAPAQALGEETNNQQENSPGIVANSCDLKDGEA